MNLHKTIANIDENNSCVLDMALNIIKQKINEVATPKNAAAWDATTDKFLFAMRLLGIESCEPIWVDEAVAMLEDELEALLQK